MMKSTDDLRKLKEERLRRLYQTDPVLYAKQVLQVEWTEQQAFIARALLKHKRVMVRASHAVGKTMLSGGLVNWFFDCFDPGIILTTAPTATQVKDLLWKEVRLQRRGRPGLSPKAPRMQTSDAHFAAGYTARDAESFQGRHEERGLIVFEEAVGVEGPFWNGATGMATGPDWLWLNIYNPTNINCRAYQEEQSGKWHVIQLSALDHPNVKAELAGKPALFPAAVRLSWVEERFGDRKWCMKLGPEDKIEPTDVEFPQGSAEWYRPGPLMESRLLGRWPTQDSQSIWNEAIWSLVTERRPLSTGPLQIGVDVARFGDDFTAIHVRRGSTSLHHESHNGWRVPQIIGRIAQLMNQYAVPGSGDSSAIAVDDGGVGGGVTDGLVEIGMPVVPVGAGENAVQKGDYPNKRSELWFNTSELAGTGLIDMSRIGTDDLLEIQRQFYAPKWTFDSAGRRVVEPKEATKKRIGRSPDDADAINLAYYGMASAAASAPAVIAASRPREMDKLAQFAGY